MRQIAGAAARAVAGHPSPARRRVGIPLLFNKHCRALAQVNAKSWEEQSLLCATPFLERRLLPLWLRIDYFR